MPGDDGLRRLQKSAQREAAATARRSSERSKRIQVTEAQIGSAFDGAGRNEPLASRIEARLADLGLNPFSAAKKAGLGNDFVRDILRGKVKHPSAQRLALLAQALETSSLHLLGGEETTLHRKVGEDIELIPIPKASEPAVGEQARSAVLLPIRYELMTDAFRRATEVTRAPLGYEAATIPIAYRDRSCWWELARDGGMSPFVPEGALCLVAEYHDDERALIEADDIIVIQKRLIERERASFNLVERSLRIVSERYPDLGMWFMEYGNEDWGISDDIFEEKEPTEPRRPLPQVMRDINADLPRLPSAPNRPVRPEDLDPDGKWKEGLDAALISRIERMMESLHRVDRALAPENREQFERELEEARQRAPRLVGKVIRVLVPTDPRAGFGIKAT